MPLTSGTQLGAYEIIAPLGSGGMGEVYRARDTRLKRDIAIKTLPLEFAHDADRLARFEREARLLASLNHPNIAAIYGLEVEGSTPHLLLELIEGETLAARLARGPLELKEALALCGQIAAAVEAAHERGIVHRDLKPGNAMIAASGVVKVLDFGLAKGDPTDASATATGLAGERGTEIGVVLGTPAYMSPEQARGKPVDRRGDVWAFGCVLYECIAGRPAFSGETTSDLIARILRQEPDWAVLPTATPGRLREVLRRCLRKDADARPRDIRDVRLELAEIAAGGAATGPASEQSIAVLPFENLSGRDDEYFSDGVTDEILNALAHVEGLRVAARSSCFAFKGRRENLRAIAERLDVATVLEGSVRRSGSRLRIQAQLVKAADGYQLWSERYDREMVDVFEVQEEIATAIATKLRGSMQKPAEHPRRGTDNLDAYELLLKGRAMQAKRGRFLLEAAELLERAIALDPNYAEAMAYLADSYRLMSVFAVGPHGDMMEKARALAERALAIDPGLAEAWATLACVAEQYDWDFPRAGELYRRALELEPRHSRARAQRTLWGYVRGAISKEDALSEMRRAVTEDPLNAWIGAMNAYVLAMMGRHEDSVVEAERAVALDRESFFAGWNLMRSLAFAGHYGRALEKTPALLRESGRHVWVLGTLAWIYGQQGRPELAAAILAELEARGRHEFMSAFWLAAAASAAGQDEKAVAYMERAVAERDGLVMWGNLSPFWERLRAHPRYRELTARLWC